MASKLVEEIRRVARLHQYSIGMEKTYAYWLRGFVALFCSTANNTRRIWVLARSKAGVEKHAT